MKGKSVCRRIVLSALVLYSVLCSVPAITAQGAQEGSWSLDEKGKRWQYLYGPEDPAEDEWIVEADGREYYVDSKGYMKTGWLTDKTDGSKYYLGDDGVKRYNMFTPDGHYVGPEGTMIESFDRYRKALKKSINKYIGGKEYKAFIASGQNPGFSLTDLNGDGRRDLLVVDHVSGFSRIVAIEVWEPNDQKFLVSSASDFTEDNEEYGSWQSWLCSNPETGFLWLVMSAQNGWEEDYFQLSDQETRFENVWHFTRDKDDWDQTVYLVNGDEVSYEEWEIFKRTAQEQAGMRIDFPCIELKKELVDAAVDQAPTEEEIDLWQ